MTQAEIDVFTALDWHTYRCQCHIHTCNGRATHIVEIHAIDHCNDAGLSPFGNWVELICAACLATLRTTIRDELAPLRRLPVRLECNTCGAPIVELGDVLRAMQAL